MTEETRAPILEWPGDGPAVIKPPRPSSGRPTLPARCVLCFFKDVLDAMAAAGRLVPLRRLPGEGDPVVVYRLTDTGGPDVAVVFPGIGAPFAVAVLEEMIGLGVRRFVACGGAGVLDGAVPLGRPVVVTKALRDEGTSYHYQRDGRFAYPDARLTADIEAACRDAGAPYLEAATWTTDAVYRETPDAVARRRAEGCVTVEMEAAAFFAAARFRGVPFGQLLYAGDDVSGETWDHRGWMEQDGARQSLLTLAIAAVRRA